MAEKKSSFMIFLSPLPFFLAAVIFLNSSGCASGIVAGRTVRTRKGAVVCVDDIAAEVGARILVEGGNAVDAAVSMGFTLAVTHPQAGNLGGGGFMVLRLADGSVTAIDYREKAPAAATPDMFLKKDGTVDKEKRDYGFLCAGVPGTVAGLEMAHRRYGRLPWRRLLEPAVDLAARGFVVDADLAAAFKSHADKLRRFKTTVRTFFKENGRPPAEGDRLVQPRLAAVLARIRDAGAAGFYRGETAEELIRAIREGGGIMTRADLADYRAVERKPVTGTFHGVTVVGMPLPSSGGTTLIEMLNILSGFDLAKMDPPSRLHYMAEAMRRAFRDRALYLGDSDFVSVPLGMLLSPERAARLGAEIDPARATDSRLLAKGFTIHEGNPEREGGKKSASEGAKDTTHFSVMDAEGNMAANTYTIEQSFGCKAVAGTTGVLMNNEMHDFNVRPGWTADDGTIGTPPNLIAPGKRMLSSMCPVILLRGSAPLAVLGSPGGRTIINTVLEVIVNLVVLGMPPEEAVAAPRFHHQWFPDRLVVEEAMPETVVKELEKRGHKIKRIPRQGDCHLIFVDSASGAMAGVADRRIDGCAAAPR